MESHQKVLNDIFDLLIEIHGKMNQKIETEAKLLGYTVKEYLVLFDVMTHQGTSQSDLCQRLGIKKSAASKLITNLESSGQLIRKTCLSDRREVKLYIEDPTLLLSLCKKEMIGHTFSNTMPIEDKLNTIYTSLQDVYTMLSGYSK